MKNFFDNETTKKVEDDLNDFIEETSTQDVPWFMKEDVKKEAEKKKVERKKKNRKTLYAYLVLPTEEFTGSYMDALSNLYGARSFKSLNSIRKQLEKDGITDYTETKVNDNKYIFRAGDVVLNAIRLVHDNDVPVN